jgi:RNA recognition motif-containing protein
MCQSNGGVRMNLYVGNLSYSTSDDGLRSAFGAYGNVVSATVITDKFSGRSRGFGFVEMSTPEEGRAAIDGLNEKPLDGRNITVSEAKPKKECFEGGGGGERSARGGGSGW